MTSTGIMTQPTIVCSGCWTTTASAPTKVKEIHRCAHASRSAVLHVKAKRSQLNLKTCWFIFEENGTMQHACHALAPQALWDHNSSSIATSQQIRSAQTTRSGLLELVVHAWHACTAQYNVYTGCSLGSVPFELSSNKAKPESSFARQLLSKMIFHILLAHQIRRQLLEGPCN